MDTESKQCAPHRPDTYNRMQVIVPLCFSYARMWRRACLTELRIAHHLKNMYTLGKKLATDLNKESRKHFNFSVTSLNILLRRAMPR